MPVIALHETSSGLIERGSFQRSFDEASIEVEDLVSLRERERTYDAIAVHAHGNNFDRCFDHTSTERGVHAVRDPDDYIRSSASKITEALSCVTDTGARANALKYFIKILLHDIKQELLVPSGIFDNSSDTHICFFLVVLDHIKSDVPNGGHVLGSISFSDSRHILLEGDI